MSSAASRALPTPLSVKAGVFAVLAVWIVLALFPLLWVTVMSFKLPVDALSSDPLTVILGPRTRAAGEGLSLLDIMLGAVAAGGALQGGGQLRASARPSLAFADSPAIGWLLAGLVIGIAGLVVVAGLLPAGLRGANALARMVGLGSLAEPVIGVTFRHYVAVWAGHGFYRNFLNSLMVTAGVVTVSLTFGTLAGYALARTPSRIAFFLLLAALVFRALPHSVLVTGYLPPFINSREILMPLWTAPLLGPVLHLFSAAPPTLYGQPGRHRRTGGDQPALHDLDAAFLLPERPGRAGRGGPRRRMFLFRGVPASHHAGDVAGRDHDGLFSFLLAYNDYLVCSLLLDAQSQTMVPAISQYFNRETTSTDQIEAIAAAVSITAPLFLLVMVFQRQIVAGLTAGAVKG